MGGRRTVWQQRLEALPRPWIGLVWAGNAAFGNDEHRSIPLACFAGLKLSRGSWVSLQKEGRAADQVVLQARGDMTDWTADLHDFSDTAALLDELDLVIAVDTAVAHLAGALGRPLWLLLPYNADWRWLLAREDSPWYPSARLFRQERPGDWMAVMGRLEAALAAFCQEGIFQNQMG